MPDLDHEGMRLAGKVAIITGGIRGIGRACFERFLAEGARIVICDLVPPDHGLVAELLNQGGEMVRYIQADVRSEADWRVALDQVASLHGKLHVLVNNAGIDMTGALDGISLSAWQRIMDINATGVFLGVRTFRDLLAESGRDLRGGSSVINISSIMGMVGHDEAAGYCASKGAVRLFTKAVGVVGRYPHSPNVSCCSFSTDCKNSSSSLCTTSRTEVSPCMSPTICPTGYVIQSTAWAR